MKKSSLRADIAFIVFLIAIIISVIFIVSDPDKATENLILFSAVIAIVILTYFTSLIVGMVMNIVCIFIYATFLIVDVVIYNNSIFAGSYFFMVLSPVMTVSVALTFLHTNELANENHKLINRLKTFATTDEKTGIRTKFAYDGELSVYRGFADRYSVDVCLLLWQYKYPNEIKRLLGNRLQRLVSEKISITAVHSFRKCDSVYLLSEDPYLWGTLLITNSDQVRQAVIDNARSHIDQLDISEIVPLKAPVVDIRFGLAVDSNIDLTGDDLIRLAKSNMQYDV